MRTSTVISFLAGLWLIQLWHQGNVSAATVPQEEQQVSSVHTFDCNAQTDIPVSDCEGLVALYTATNGDFWYENAGWLASSPCTWFGVECVIFGYYNLRLYWNGLSGPLPPEIGNLKHALIVDLSTNDLTGSIPPELGSLTSLAGLYMTGTQLGGPIPPELGNLTNLVDLYLGYDQLTGTIPPELGNLPKLRDLHLSLSELSGEIPQELGDLPSLRRLILSQNDLSGPIPESLFNLSTLWVLDLGHNRLSGGIPDLFDNLPQLRDLWLSNNRLTGPIPSSIGDLTGLVTLDLDSNDLSGTIPPQLGQFDELERLVLNNNDLGGTVPLPVARVGAQAGPLLTDCNFRGNRLCMPDIQAYRALGNQICGLQLEASCPPVVHVESKALLQGPFVGGEMRNVMTFREHIPIDQPYSSPFYDGTSVDYDSSVSVSSLPDSVLDWVLVSLRPTPESDSEIASSERVAFLHQNGSIVDTTGKTPAFHGVVPGGYHLVVRHRNHAGVMSADTLDLSDGLGSWDFTTSMSQAYSAGGAPMKDLGGGKFGLFACDSNVDGAITGADFILWLASATKGDSGYGQADCNLDGNVTARDFNLWNTTTSAGAASRVPD